MGSGKFGKSARATLRQIELKLPLHAQLPLHIAFGYCEIRIINNQYYHMAYF